MVSTSPDFEKDLLNRLTGENSNRRITRVEGSRWGRLILPAPDESEKRTHKGLRLVIIGSWTLGLLTLETLLASEKLSNGGINLVGIVTDDPLDVDAKISVNKRFWRYYDASEREEYEWSILHRALSMGIPCFTGEVKTRAFREILDKWAPDAIVVAAFGQVIDKKIINMPDYGIYNIHPSDLLHSHGAGPQPWEDLIERKASVTRVTLHRVSPTIDDGDIVGQSPDINLRLPDNNVSEDVRMIGEKSLMPVGPMVRALALALLEKKATGVRGALNYIDFDRILDQEFKSKLMEPLDPLKRGHILPLPKEEEQYTV